MNNFKKLKRNEFIRLTLLGGAGLYLNSCGTGNNPVEKKGPSKDTLPVKAAAPAIEPTYKIYKKGDAQYEVLRVGFNKISISFPWP